MLQEQCSSCKPPRPRGKGWSQGTEYGDLHSDNTATGLGKSVVQTLSLVQAVPCTSKAPSAPLLHQLPASQSPAWRKRLWSRRAESPLVRCEWMAGEPHMVVDPQGENIPERAPMFKHRHSAISRRCSTAPVNRAGPEHVPGCAATGAKQRPRPTEAGDDCSRALYSPGPTGRLMPSRGWGCAQAEADPFPTLLAALSAAADAAAVRWKQHRELSTWRLVKEKKKGSAGGWLRIRGNFAAGSRRSFSGQAFAAAVPCTAQSQRALGAVRSPGCTSPAKSCRIYFVGREAKDGGGEVTAGGDADRRKSECLGNNLIAYSALVICLMPWDSHLL